MMAEPREPTEGAIRMPGNDSGAGVENADRCRQRRFLAASLTINGTAAIANRSHGPAVNLFFCLVHWVLQRYGSGQPPASKPGCSYDASVLDRPIAADPVADPGGPVPRLAASGVVSCVSPSPKRRLDGSVSRPLGKPRFAREPIRCRWARLANTRAAFVAGSPLQPHPWQLNRAWFLRDSGSCCPQA